MIVLYTQTLLLHSYANNNSFAFALCLLQKSILVVCRPASKKCVCMLQKAQLIIFPLHIYTYSKHESQQFCSATCKSMNALPHADVKDDLLLIDAVLQGSPSAEGPEGGIVGCKERGMG